MYLLHSLFDFGPMAKAYDHWYDTQHGQLHDRFQKDLVRKFLPLAKPGDRLLDVGCGTGHWSRFFSSLGYEVLGIDISAEMIEVARSHMVEHCQFEVAKADILPFKDGSFDAITAITTLECLLHPENTLAEMVRCLKPGGRIIIGTLNRLAYLNRRRVALGREPYSSANMFSPRELRALLIRYGSVRLSVTAEGASGSEYEFPLPLWQRIVRLLTGTRGALIVAEVRP